MNKVFDFIEQNKMLKKGDSVVVGISGGADSVCMLNLLNSYRDKLGISLFALHVNHHIRGQEADRDEAFVEALCKNLMIPCRTVHVDVPKLAIEQSISEEEAGRYARYNAFEEYCKEVGAQKIAVAHNKDDVAETVLHNLFRGTGIKGLSGIPSTRKLDSGITIIRPLLAVTRAEIEAYLSKCNMTFQTDSTNEETDYTRNRIRLKLIPYIEECINSSARANIIQAADTLSEISQYMDMQIVQAYQKYVKDFLWHSSGFDLPRPIATGLIRLMIDRLVGTLKDITKTHIDFVMDLRFKQVGKKIEIPYNIVFERTYDGIKAYVDEGRGRVWADSNNYYSETDYVSQAPVEMDYDDQALAETDCESQTPVEMVVEDAPDDVASIPKLLYTKWLDYDKIKKPLIRHRLPGDYIVIDQKGGRKKLKDYLIDEKVPRAKRDDLWLVADGSKVLWVVGHRISEDCKVSATTKKVLKLSADPTI